MLTNYNYNIYCIFTLKKYTVSKNYNAKERVPNPAFVKHYEFELEVLAVNQTIGVKLLTLETYILCSPI